jgi:hypothetical protein
VPLHIVGIGDDEQAMPGPRMMFIKSWNEWGEGAIMEPDKVFGRASSALSSAA